MEQTVNVPLCRIALDEYASGADLCREISACGCNGIEGIWAGEDVPAEFSPEMILGYHLTFFSDWLDLYLEDRAALERKYGSMDNVRRFYGGTGRDALLSLYREDMERAAALAPKYVVFHVSDVSVEECYTYRWLHSSEAVIDSAVELINTLLTGRDWPFEFLMENQWWPGFTFTDPRLTARLLDGVRYERKGVMLDTGHLMNTNIELGTQPEGAEYIRKMLDRHGSLSDMIRGVHLHQSLSGTYVKENTGFLPDGLPEDPAEQYSVSYGHICQIDRHEPWDNMAILPILERIDPEYVTHELAAKSLKRRLELAGRQSKLLRGLAPSD